MKTALRYILYGTCTLVWSGCVWGMNSPEKTFSQEPGKQVGVQLGQDQKTQVTLKETGDELETMTPESLEKFTNPTYVPSLASQELEEPPVIPDKTFLRDPLCLRMVVGGVGCALCLAAWMYQLAHL